jgi:hypothetical protein
LTIPLVETVEEKGREVHRNQVETVDLVGSVQQALPLAASKEQVMEQDDEFDYEAALLDVTPGNDVPVLLPSSSFSSSSSSSTYSTSTVPLSLPAAVPVRLEQYAQLQAQAQSQQHQQLAEQETVSAGAAKLHAVVSQVAVAAVVAFIPPSSPHPLFCASVPSEAQGSLKITPTEIRTEVDELSQLLSMEGFGQGGDYDFSQFGSATPPPPEVIRGGAGQTTLGWDGSLARPVSGGGGGVGAITPGRLSPPREALAIIADSKDINASGVHAMLRTDHNVTSFVTSLPDVHYVLSARAGALRIGCEELKIKFKLEKFKARLSQARRTFDIVYVVVQDNSRYTKEYRDKAGPDNALEKIMVSLALQPRIVYLHSDGDADMAQLLRALIESEANPAVHVLPPRVVARLATDDAARLAVAFLTTAPGLNVYAAALLLGAHAFKVGRILRCSEEQLASVTGIGAQRAKALYAFWRRVPARDKNVNVGN